MAKANTNSMAAIMSHVVRAIFWIAVFSLIIGSLIITTGLIGSLNGGTIKLPWVEALAQGVPPGRLVVALVGIVVFATGIAFVCSQLRSILSTLADGDPFVPENGPRLTRIAIAIGMIEIVRTLAVLLISATVDLGENYEVVIRFNLAVWGAVIVLLILAQVFREGTRLREEEKMTI
ncbi:MAG: DUF2975 domain-containing protein [Pseudomonadota bacterium]